METQYRPIDVKKDKPQIGDVFMLPLNMSRVEINPNNPYVDGVRYFRPAHLDLDGGKYRLLNQTDEDHSRNDIEVFDPVRNQWEPNHGKFIIGFTYRVPVEAKKKPVTGATVMGTHMGFLPEQLNGAYLREHFLKIQSMLNEIFPLQKEEIKQCTCKVIPSGLPEALFLFPKKNCPIKAHADHSQLQGSKREIELPKEKAPFVFPSYEECKSKCDHRKDHSLTVYLYLEAMYHKYLKSTCAE